jgi:large subunit ribosomal protein L13
MRTFTPKSTDVTRNWHLIDATDVVLGRLSTTAANLLRGKNKPTYAPHVDGGDYVVIINSDKIALSGNKLEDKKLYRHSGFPGGLSTVTYREQLERDSRRIVEHAVKGMLPNNRLAKEQLGRLRVFAGNEHTHVAQKPVEYKIVQIAQ